MYLGISYTYASFFKLLLTRFIKRLKFEKFVDFISFTRLFSDISTLLTSHCEGRDLVLYL